jgi:hypothetical protein
MTGRTCLVSALLARAMPAQDFRQGQVLPSLPLRRRNRSPSAARAPLITSAAQQSKTSADAPLTPQANDWPGFMPARTQPDPVAAQHLFRPPPLRLAPPRMARPIRGSRPALRRRWAHPPPRNMLNMASPFGHPPYSLPSSGAVRAPWARSANFSLALSMYFCKFWLGSPADELTVFPLSHSPPAFRPRQELVRRALVLGRVRGARAQHRSTEVLRRLLSPTVTSPARLATS